MRGADCSAIAGRFAATLLSATCLTLCPVLAGSAWAADFFVSNGGDSGAGSLRQAIFDSNAAGGTNTITINSGVGTVTLSRSLPMITASVTVTGNNSTVNANNTGRAFFVQSGTVAISNLTINNAVAQGGAGGATNNANGGGGGRQLRQQHDLHHRQCDGRGERRLFRRDQQLQIGRAHV